MTEDGELYVPDLHKLRRFALIIGLVLVSYSLAGVELKEDETITPLGLPLVISRPNLVPMALIIASMYGASRFFFYGVLIAGTPTRRRKELIQQLRSTDVRKSVEDFKEALKSVIPNPWSRTNVIDSFGDDLPGLRRFLSNLPWKYRVAIFVQNSDYLAPVWVNILAVFITLLNFIA